MRYIQFIALLFQIQLHAQKTFAVRGVVMMKPQFCGGMALTNEEMGRFRAYPMKNKVMIIRLGDSNDIHAPVFKEITTDSNGEFCIDLAPGTYALSELLKKDDSYIRSIIRQYPVKTEYYEAADEQCLREWLSKPDAVVKVIKSDPEKITIYFYGNCPWNILCVRYFGPAPS